VRALIASDKVSAVHDISDGGLLVTLAEMALAGGIGCRLSIDLNAAQAFGEDQGRYLITASADEFIENAMQIGTVGGNTIVGVPLADLREASDSFFRDWMET